MKNILLIGTLDTKGDELLFMKELVEKAHHCPIVMDIGILGESKFKADITRQDVIGHIGKDIEYLIALQNEGEAIKLMSSAVEVVLKKLYQEGKIDGTVGIGGGQGCSMCSPGMKQLPVGFPKVLVSTKAAQAGIKEYAGTKDVVIIPAVCDIAGLNRITRDVLKNAVGAILGMVSIEAAPHRGEPVVVMSMNGTVTTSGLYIKDLLEKDGYEVIVFHTLGVGGKAMEELIENIDVDCVIELALNEIGNELFGGLASAGKERLEAAGRRGVTQIVTPGSIDFINFLTMETVPEKYRNRRLYSHNPQATCMRMEKEEMRVIGQVIAEKVNKSRGKLEIMIPLKGFSMWDKEEKVFYDLEADRHFIESFKKHISPVIQVTEYDLHINDRSFADLVYKRFTELVRPI